ncbi:MAG: riboflavin synthase [Hyphomonadaceae bacterium]
MFTGIISALGEITGIERRQGLTRLTVSSPYDPAGVAIGASIAHDGCCLTVVEKTSAPGGMRHVVEVAAESLAVTTLGTLAEGDRVNLERALRAGDELGGHIVTGHVDGQGEVRAVRADGEGFRVRISPPAELAKFITAKGCVAVAGVSLTVNEVDAEGFGMLIIPHTWAVTTLAKLKPGDKVNLEIDPLARYVARLLSERSK